MGTYEYTVTGIEHETERGPMEADASLEYSVRLTDESYSDAFGTVQRKGIEVCHEDGTLTVLGNGGEVLYEEEIEDIFDYASEKELIADYLLKHHTEEEGK